MAINPMISIEVSAQGFATINNNAGRTKSFSIVMGDTQLRNLDQPDSKAIVRIVKSMIKIMAENDDLFSNNHAYSLGLAGQSLGDVMRDDNTKLGSLKLKDETISKVNAVYQKCKQAQIVASKEKSDGILTLVPNVTRNVAKSTAQSAADTKEADSKTLKSKTGAKSKVPAKSTKTQPTKKRTIVRPSKIKTRLNQIAASKANKGKTGTQNLSSQSTSTAASSTAAETNTTGTKSKPAAVASSTKKSEMDTKHSQSGTLGMAPSSNVTSRPPSIGDLPSPTSASSKSSHRADKFDSADEQPSPPDSTNSKSSNRSQPFISPRSAKKSDDSFPL